MFSDKNIVETLNQLGLSHLESKIYLALCKYQDLSTKTISRLTKTPQPDTYRVLAKLQEKGLVEKIIKRPAKFKIVPCDKGINSLLERKKAEFVDLEKNTKLSLSSLKERTITESGENQGLQFVLIPQREAVVDKIRVAIDRARKSVDLFLSWKRFLPGMTVTFAENVEKAWKRGVRFRIVVENPSTAEEAEQAMQISGKSPFCKIRFLRGFPKTVIGTYDKKEVFIIVNPKESLLGSPALWSNSQSLISLVKDYFDFLWLTSIEEPEISTEVFNH
jgi:sugar-specific transcriptional regulator TrmB